VADIPIEILEHAMEASGTLLKYDEVLDRDIPIQSGLLLNIQTVKCEEDMIKWLMHVTDTSHALSYARHFI